MGDDDDQRFEVFVLCNQWAGAEIQTELCVCKLWSWCAEVTFWVITGERQAARIRSKYLKAILRQDVTFFDKETSTGEVVGRMAGDTVLIQDAIGEKVYPIFFPSFAHHHQSGIVGFIMKVMFDIQIHVCSFCETNL
jgi:ABC-type multidrug transport system fused ATPase/permease subunit